MARTLSSSALVLVTVFAGTAAADTPPGEGGTPSDVAAGTTKDAPSTPTPNPADEKACAKKNGKACERIGDSYLDGATKDRAKALTYYLKGCTFNAGAACGFAASVIEGTEEPKPDLKKVFSLYTKGCKLKDSRSCNNLGTSWSNGDNGAPSQDFSKAFTFYTQACKLDNGLGCFNLGNAYRLGESVKIDLPKAITFFKKSCDLKEARGCTELGVAYYEGKGVTKDVAAAVTYLELSCSLGSQAGCKNVELLKKASAKKP